MEQGSSFTDWLIVIAVDGFFLLMLLGFASFVGTLLSNLINCGCQQREESEEYEDYKEYKKNKKRKKKKRKPDEVW